MFFVTKAITSGSAGLFLEFRHVRKQMKSSWDSGLTCSAGHCGPGRTPASERVAFWNNCGLPACSRESGPPHSCWQFCLMTGWHLGHSNTGNSRFIPMHSPVSEKTGILKREQGKSD